MRPEEIAPEDSRKTQPKKIKVRRLAKMETKGWPASHGNSN
ncbi:hypothetical protein [Nonomuraea sp. NPDC049158]